MTEEEMERSVRRGKAFNYTVFGVLVLLLLGVGVFVAKYQYEHTFTTEKWLASPTNRVMIVLDLLRDYALVGMTREEAEALLGPGEERDTFSGKLEGEQSGELLVYHLGMSAMNEQWLILRFKDGQVTSAVSDIT